MNPTPHDFIAICVMLHAADGGLAGSVALKLPRGEWLSLAASPPSDSLRRIVFDRDDHWWLVLSDVRSHRARLPSGELITQAEHSLHCDTIDGEACLRLDDFLSGKVKFDRFALLYNFKETDLVAHPCVMLPDADAE